MSADCAVEWLAAQAAGRPESAGSWVDIVYREVRVGRALMPSFVDSAAVNAGMPRARSVDPAFTARVNDPFLAPFVLAHTPPRVPYPLAQVLALGERLALREAARARSQRVHGAEAGTTLSVSTTT